MYIYIYNLPSLCSGKYGFSIFSFRCLNYCLFVWGILSHSRNFHSFGDVTIAGEALQIFTYARHSWSLSSEGSLTCNTYCGQPFIWSSLWVRDTHTCCRAFSSKAVTTCFNDLGMSRPGIEPRSSASKTNVLPLRHRGVSFQCILSFLVVSISPSNEVWPSRLANMNLLSQTKLVFLMRQ